MCVMTTIYYYYSILLFINVIIWNDETISLDIYKTEVIAHDLFKVNRFKICAVWEVPSAQSFHFSILPTNKQTQKKRQKKR